MREQDVIILIFLTILSYMFHKILSWIEPKSKSETQHFLESGGGRPRSSSFSSRQCSSPHSSHRRRFSLDYIPESMSPSSRPSSSKDIIKIAVDATPKRAAGLLVLPKQKLVYFYSIEWTHFFDFRCEPDKFEMVNAFLALQIFKEYITPYRKLYGEKALLLKTDNNLCVRPHTIYSRQRDAKWSQLFQDIDSTLRNEHFDGDWDYTCKHKDVYLKIADKLSKGDHSTSKSLPGIEFKSLNYPVPFQQYKPTNVSGEDKWMLYPTRRQLQWLEIHEILA